MKNRIFALFTALLLSFTLGGCFAISGTSPDILAAVPYSFSGSSGDYQVTYEIRQITEEEITKIPEKYQEGVTTENGYRTAVRIAYTGDKIFQYLAYTFAKGNKWEYANSFPVNEGAEEKFTKSLDGSVELSGKVCTNDGSLGGPLPPPDGEYTFQIVTQATDGTSETIDLTLTKVAE